MKIYTKTGDTGETGLLGGIRVRKYDERIEVYGTIDELNSALGLARCDTGDSQLDDLLRSFQDELFTLGAELSAANPDKVGLRVIGPQEIARLEQAIDAHDAQLPMLKEFVLPGGNRLAAELHLARTVCRRAERLAVHLHDLHPARVRVEIIMYLNRLSDLLFVLARYANHVAGVADIPWRKPD
jgi:cob(I)alamin adenosyltransferase